LVVVTDQRRTFTIDQVRLAAAAAEDGPPVAVTVGDRGVIVMKWFPMTRGRPLVERDGSDLLATEDGPAFDLSDIKE
jgi:hypothetical protein